MIENMAVLDRLKHKEEQQLSQYRRAYEDTDD
jgi:hypothetical protein